MFAIGSGVERAMQWRRMITDDIHHGALNGLDDSKITGRGDGCHLPSWYVRNCHNFTPIRNFAIGDVNRR